MKHLSLTINQAFTRCFLSIIIMLLSITTMAQVKVGDNPNSIKNASLLELESTNKGLALPRVSLTGALNNPAPLATDILQGTEVYNTNAAFIGGVGLFIWTGTTWMAVTPTSTGSTDAWKLIGNAGTDPSVNFIGTTDAQPLVFKVSGQKSGYIDVASANTSMGFLSLSSLSSGTNNAAMGFNALADNSTGTNNTATGYKALQHNISGSNNTANGIASLYFNTAGTNNNAIGNTALYNNTTGSNNVANGYQALFTNTTGTYNTAIGDNADVSSNNLTNATAIGHNAKVAVSNAFVLGDSTDNVKVGIGTGSPTANLHVKGSVRFAGLTNGLLTTDATGNLSTTTVSAINGNSWSLTGNSGTNPSTNFLGTTDAQPLVFKVNGQPAGKIDYLNSLANTSLGYQTLFNNTTGQYNTANGYNSLYHNTTGFTNTANGYISLYNNTTGYNNTATGTALYFNTTGNDNSGYGLRSLSENTSGSENDAYGDSTLITNTTGSYNTAIGHHADVASNNLTNATAIGANAKVTISNALVLGDSTDNVKVGIGTGSPTANLHVKGTVRFAGLTNGILTTDALGNLGTTTLSAINSSSWSLTGNSGTNPAINFLGTTDVRPLLFKVNGQFAGKIDSTNVFFGVLSSSASTGNYNASFGYKALYANTTANQNSAFGSFALQSNAGIQNTAFGSYALGNSTTGINNTAVGLAALKINTSGNDNTAIGAGADVSSNNLTNATVIGYSAQVAISNAVVLGDSVDNIKVGIGTGSPTANLHVKGTVRFAGLTNGFLTTDAIGNLSVASAASITSNSWSLTGNSGTDSTINFLGTINAQPLVFKVNGQKAGKIEYAISSGNTAYGYQSLNVNTGIKNTAAGYQALAQNTIGNYNTAVGNISLSRNTTGYGNTAVGYLSLTNNTTGNLNTSAGYFSLTANTSGGSNTANGFGTLYNNTTGYLNTANGFSALYYSTSGRNNTANGGYTLSNNTTGSFNTAYGDSSLLTNTTGNFNTAIGHYADVSANNLTNATAIGYNAKVAASNSLVLGNNSVNVGIGTSSPQRKLQVYNNGYGITQTNGTVEVGTYVDNAYGWIGTASNHPLAFFTNDGDPSMLLNTNGNFGIGTNNPSANLHVNGTVRFASLTNGVLTTDATGNLSTTSLASITGSSWSLTGNSGTNPSTNFLGTTDAQPLIFKVNGQQAGRIDYSGFSANNSLGYQTLLNNTTGDFNTANGYQALYSNTNGSENTANGYGALYSNTSGYDNTANGNTALSANTTGYDNTGSGNSALSSNTSGYYNTALGYKADVSSGNLVNSTAIGYNAKAAISNALILGDSTDNVKVGIGTGSPTANLHVKGSVRFAGLTNGVLTADANGNLSTTNLASNSWGLTGNSGTNPSNNFIGTTDAQPLIFKVNGQQAGRIDYNIASANTSLGYQSLNVVTTGAFNTANGYQALYSNTTGSANVANGNLALTNNTTGTYNAANGYRALYSNTSGSSNTANGDAAFSYNTTGNDNVADGAGALSGNTTGNGNTAIGSYANVAVSNAMVLGNGTINVGIGTSSPGYTLDVNGGIRCIGAVVTTSDARLKQDIRPIGDALTGVLGLRGVRYTFRIGEYAAMKLPQGEQIGLLAQEVEKIYPELVSTDDKGYKAVNYAQLAPVLIEAIKEQQQEIEILKTKNSDAQKANTSIKQDVETLKAQMKILMDKINSAAKSN